MKGLISVRVYVCFIGLSIMAVLFASCGEERVTRLTGSKAPDTTVIFPLAVGNKWIYDDASQSDSVTASILQHGKTYYILEGLFRGPISVRMNDQQQLVVRREHESCDEYVLFDFGTEPGDRWPIFAPCSDTLHSDVMVFYQRLDSVTVPAGTYRDCFQFYWDPSITDAGADWTIAPGIGVISFGYVSLGGSRSYKLVEFIEAEE